MSAQLISGIWTVLDERKDNAHLILELIGSYSLGVFAKPPPAPSQSLSGTRDITRQLLVRLNVVINHQLHSLALRDTGHQVTQELILPRDLSYELLVYILSIANWLNPPATVGSIQYALHRGLFFTVLQTAFRCLSLYPEPLDQLDADTLRQRILQICQTWEGHRPLSSIESLVLRYIIPQTIDELQQRTEYSSLKRFLCERFNLEDYRMGRSPLCPEPGDPHWRAASFRICQEVLRSTIGGSQESNWLQSCWTLHDTGWALQDSAVKSFSSSGSQNHSSFSYLIDTSSVELWDTVRHLQESLDSTTRNILLCNYFAERIARISGHSWSILPPGLPTSVDLVQCLEFEVLDFHAYLDARDQLLQQQYSATTTRAWVVSEQSQSGGGPSPSPLPSAISGPIPSRVPIPQQLSRDPILTPSPTGTYQTAQQEPPQRQEPEPFRSTIAAPASYDEGEPVDNNGGTTSPIRRNVQVPRPQDEYRPGQGYPDRLPYQTDDYRKSGSTGPQSRRSDDQGRFSPNHSRSGGTRTPWSESEISLHTVNVPLVERKLHTIPGPSPEPSVGAPDYGSSGYRTPSSQQDRPPTSNIRYPNNVGNSSTYEPSVATSSRTSKSKKWGGIISSMSERIKAPSLISVKSTISMPVVKDLGFCFSSEGTSLLIWETKNAEYIIRLFWPFRDGQKLKLRSFSLDNPIEDGAGSWTVKLVEGGNSVAAAVVSVNKSYKLLYFDGTGARFEIPFPRSDLIPISLAVSRDDSMIALGCGTAIFLFVINPNDGSHHLLSEIPSHSRPRPNIGNRRRQRLNFSPDSSALIAATQEPMNPAEKISNTNSGQDTQVHVCLWKLTSLDQSRTPRLEAELDDIFLSLGRGNDPGLTSISVSLAPTTRIFMTALSFQNYSWILVPGGTGHKRIPLAERRITSVAQSSLMAQGGGNIIAFKSGAHNIVTVDVRTGVTSPLISFAQERGNLRMGQDGMVVAFAPNNTAGGASAGGINGDKGGLVFAFWKGWEGQLVLKQVEVGFSTMGGDASGFGQGGGSGSRMGAGAGAVVSGEELQAVYWYVVHRG